MLRSMCNNFRKWKSSYRVFIVFLSVLVFTFIREDYLRQYAQDVGLAVTPYFFAFQMDDGITRMSFYFGVVLLFCNAPFMDDQQMFVLVRTGRLRWFAGQLAYIVAANLVYFLWTALTTVLVLIPQVGFSTDWGGIIRMCAENNGLAGVVMHKEIVEAYTPLAACLITYGLNVLVGTLLGLVVFLGNMLGSRIYGSAVAIGWIVFSNMIDVVRLPKLRVLSPLHWTTTYAYLRSDDAVPLWYILAVESAIILVTGFIIMKKSKTYTLDAIESGL